MSWKKKKNLAGAGFHRRLVQDVTYNVKRGQKERKKKKSVPIPCFCAVERDFFRLNSK